MEIEISSIYNDELNLFRIDNDYFKKEYLEIYYKFKDKTKISDIAQRVVCGPFGATILNETYTEKGVTVVRPFNIKGVFIENSNLVYIPKEDIKKKGLHYFDKEDLLFARVGDIRCGINLYDKITISPNIISVEISKKNKLFDPFFLAIFFNTKYGILQLQRASKMVAQPTISTDTIKNLRLPTVNQDIQSQIKVIVNKSYKIQQISQSLYTQAEDLLLEELGLKDFKPTNKQGNLKEGIAVKNYSESMGDSGRIDAEYYQPKYEEILERIEGYKNGYEKFSNFIDSYSTGFAFKSTSYQDNGISLIRINNIGKNNLDLFNAPKIPYQDIKLSPLDVVNENDILISMSGTIGNSCKIPKGIKAVINQRIMRITSKGFNYDVLPLVINSIVGYYQLVRIGTGGVQTNISSTDIKEIMIPVLFDSIQTTIAEKIQKSFALRRKSERLLEIAKRGVEMAIEKDEKTAMEWMETETK